MSPNGVEFPATCGTVDPTYKSGFTAPKLLLLKTPNWFVLNSGLADYLPNEETLVGVLAHELGHYYRFHINPFKNEYNFFYTQDEAGNPGHKPIPNASLETFGKEVLKQSAAYYPVNLMPKANTFKLDPIIYLAIGDIARQASSLPNCVLAAEYDHGDNARVLAAMPYSPPNSIETYDAFTTVALQCLADIEAADAIKQEIDIESAIKTPKWAPFLRNNLISRDGKTEMTKYTMTVFGVIGSNVAVPKSFTKADILNLAVTLRANVGKINDTLQQAYDTRLGLYTTEQEADELSLEILANMGLGGKSAVDTYMIFLNPDEEVGGFDIGLQRCEKMRANQWIDPEGRFNLKLLPIGDYTDPHHGACYRIFNLSREIEAHKYALSPPSPLDPSVWTKMKQDLNHGGISFSEPNEARNLNRIRFHPKGCAFAPKD